MVLRGLTGLIIGLGYGVLVGALTFLLWCASHDSALPGPLIPDNNEWGRIVTVIAALIAGGCGAVVGLIVGLSGVNRGRGGVIGLAIGMAVLLSLSANSWAEVTKLAWREWRTLFALSTKSI